LAAAVQSVHNTVLPLIEAKGHEMSVTVPPEPIYLNADPTRLAQILTNLLDNAAKYMDKGGRVMLTATRQGHEVVFSVRDYGIGIDPKHLPRLFEMFSQLTPALERSQGGLGLGLALVRGLVELHGGSVEARSAGAGQGSEFIVRLPVADAPVEEKSNVVDTGMADVGAPRRRILYVEDNRDTAATMTMILKEMGHEVATTFDGLQALEIAKNFRPEIVLLDIGLPNMNGYDVARRLRAQAIGQQLTLIALSGWGQDDDKKRALTSGFNLHLTKPIKAAELKKLLATLPLSKPTSAS
jgi:CheY-like chemotaxis protein